MFSLKAIVDYIKLAPKDKPIDKFNILSPLLATGEYITAAKDAFLLFKSSSYGDVLAGKIKPANKNVERAVVAYKDYVSSLAGHDRNLERAQPFSTILLSLESISGNLTAIEDNFQTLFGSLSKDGADVPMRASSLVVIGYLEQSNAFAMWLSGLVEHMTAEQDDMIPPFRTKELVSKASDMGEFASFNLNKWNFKTKGFLSEITEMQHKGADLTLQAEDGEWIDQYAHNNQFTPVEQELMTASLRSPIMMLITWNHVRLQDKIDLLSSRKDWLTSKVILEQSRMRGMDPNSPEYKRLKTATDKYSAIASKYEQKIERMRA